MNCSICRHANPTQSKFCNQCGTFIVHAVHAEDKNTVIDIIHDYTNYMPDMQKNIMSCYEIFHFAKPIKADRYPSAFSNAYQLINYEYNNTIFKSKFYFEIVNNNTMNWKINISDRGSNRILNNVFVAKQMWDYFFSEFLIKFENMINDGGSYQIYINSIEPLFDSNLHADMKKSWDIMRGDFDLLNLNNVFIVFVKISKYIQKDDKMDEYHFNQLFTLTTGDMENMFPMLKEKNWFSLKFKDDKYPWFSFEQFLKDFMPYLNYECTKYYIELPTYNKTMAK